VDPRNPVKDRLDLLLTRHAHDHLEEDEEVVQSRPSVQVRPRHGANFAEIDPIRHHRPSLDRGHAAEIGPSDERVEIIGEPPRSFPTTIEAKDALMFSKVAAHAMIAV
jgi:hypothetical protein